MIKTIVLCGGRGCRLWPLSRSMYPKQFLKVHGDKTLFQHTVGRAKGVPGLSSLTVLCNSDNRFLVAEQLRELDEEADIVLEPVGRDTAAAVAASAFLAIDEDPLLLVLPADHIINDEETFVNEVAKAASLAEEGYLVTFGITPASPEVGFGYIQSGDSLGEGFAIRKFVEKPDLSTAQKYVDAGNFFWNSGMFMFKASTFLGELKKFCPEIYSACEKAVADRYEDMDFSRLHEESFAESPAISIDYAIMERTDKGAMVTLDAGWSDLGSWKAIFDVNDKDENGNVTAGDVITEDTSGCLLQAGARLLAAVGVQDIVVVETKDAVLVADKNKVQNVKKVVDSLKSDGRIEVDLHTKVFRPWGAYEGVDAEDRFQVKRLSVKPGQVLSLQKHHHRAEHWVVVRGTAKITNGDKEFLLTEDQSTYIPVGEVHRLENPGRIPLELIEVQTGSYLGEDDIVRFEDLYGRSEG